ncbi:hypothetical protein EV140_0204 [Microcella alkaliphila]|uniref:Uncharacterized protein n=1 Tax=Microcella alkaliphila TaxID=279828 RepID=A0A4Q7TSI6_9MICO|nr:hypothetical protein [Microcella alkaliphila]RZT63974.1 hypothetical protein EV140_0204 [Microcella alkaliphila]
MTAPVSPVNVSASHSATDAATVAIPIGFVVVPRRPLTPATLPWSTA